MFCTPPLAVQLGTETQMVTLLCPHRWLGHILMPSPPGFRATNSDSLFGIWQRLFPSDPPPSTHNCSCFLSQQLLSSTWCGRTCLSRLFVLFISHWLVKLHGSFHRNSRPFVFTLHCFRLHGGSWLLMRSVTRLECLTRSVRVMNRVPSVVSWIVCGIRLALPFF